MELDAETPNLVVIHMPEMNGMKLGDTMRLGSRPTHFRFSSECSKIRALYSEGIIHERHLHRYEVNPAYFSKLSSQRLNFVGKDDEGERMEISN